MLFSGLCEQSSMAAFAAGLRGWSNTPRHFTRWRDKGIREKLLEILMDDPDYEWLMIDTSHGKVHPHASEARGDKSGERESSTPRYIWPRMRMVCRSKSLLHQVPLLITCKLAA
ncbi:putative transposase [Nitrosomonas eutropha C91]|uniref:Putative transposase n=1 Tax=Nitrosomonas eutropha (strain DSM 101675 / C91 / Nm57) TaxID=335283 RepID=Q0ADK3_NITEC|nr:putative transposase [Nitrosomonas eutropha C91]